VTGDIMFVIFKFKWNFES